MVAEWDGSFARPAFAVREYAIEKYGVSLQAKPERIIERKRRGYTEVDYLRIVRRWLLRSLERGGHTSAVLSCELHVRESVPDWHKPVRRFAFWAGAVRVVEPEDRDMVQRWLDDPERRTARILIPVATDYGYSRS